MSLKGDSMKKSHLYSAILIALFVLTSNIEKFPKVTALPPAPIPDSFISDIFPNNNNTIIHLLNINVNITLNASERYNEIGISFNGKYSLFNPDNLTNLTIILPFSLCLDIEHATFGVSVNDTEVPFEVVSTTEENLTSTGVNIDFIPEYLGFLHCPITLITTNLTLMENTTYVVKYLFEGSIPEPLSDQIFYMIYSSETAKFWKGNATERVEYNVLGGNAVFDTTLTGFYYNYPRVLDFIEGKKFVCEWDNAQRGSNRIGVRFDERIYDPYFVTIEIIVLNIFGYVAIIIVVVLWIKRRKRKQFRLGIKKQKVE